MPVPVRITRLGSKRITRAVWIFRFTSGLLARTPTILARVTKIPRPFLDYFRYILERAKIAEIR